jgi:hypothetical protein
MSTSDPRLQLDETAVSHAKTAVAAALPEVTALTQMANAFFRSLPGQDVEDVAQHASPDLPAFTSAGIPVSKLRLPEFDIPAPSLPHLQFTTPPREMGVAKRDIWNCREETHRIGWIDGFECAFKFSEVIELCV